MPRGETEKWLQKKWLAGWKEWKGNSVILIANYKRKVAGIEI